MKIKIPISKETDCEEVHKSIAEQVWYVNDRIQKAWIDKNFLFVEINDEEIDISGIKEQLCKMCERVVSSFERIPFTPVDEYGSPPISFPEHPLPHLIQTNQVMPLTFGSFGYKGHFLRNLNLLDERIQSIATDYGAIEELYPVLVDLEAMIQNGYLHAFPQHLFFVSSVREGAQGIDEVSSDAKMGNLNQIKHTLRRQNRLRAALAPTVCYNCFEARRSTKLQETPSIVTARNLVHRYESLNTTGLERLQSFNMREIVFFGSAEEVETIRSELKQQAINMSLNLGLYFRVTEATDPFFALDAADKRLFQSLMKLKFEMQCFIPQTSKWLAVASFNVHGSHLSGIYDIHRISSSVYSGCVGFGLERLLFSIYCQRGMDVEL